MAHDLIFAFHKQKIQSNLLQGMQMYFGHVNALTKSASKYRNITRGNQILDFKFRSGPCTHRLGKRGHTITCAWRAIGDLAITLYTS